MGSSHRHCTPRRRLLAALALIPTAACGRAAATSGTDARQQRLLERIIREQEARVDVAAASVREADEASRALRMRQQMLVEAGRLDLAVKLDAEAADKEAELRVVRQRLADEQAALDAYRAHAARTGRRREAAADASQARGNAVPASGPAARAS